uniref:Uncharacterized protein n=1 Tax=Anguilla anguilla TaxID=7936 RepID=A0A0E9PCQ5_ANGAN
MFFHFFLEKHENVFFQSTFVSGTEKNPLQYPVVILFKWI